MALTREELRRINSERLAEIGKIYTGDDGRNYVGTNEKRLRLSLNPQNTTSTSVSFNPTTNTLSTNAMISVDVNGVLVGTEPVLNFIGGSGLTLSITDNPLNNRIDLNLSSTVLASAMTKVDDTNVTLTLGGSPLVSLLAATSLTLGWTGTLAEARLSTTAVVAGSYGSATQVGTFTVSATGRLTAATNVTITPAASSITGGQILSKVDDTNVTLTLGGTPLTSLLAATSLTLGWTGTLAEARLSTTAVVAGSYGSATQTGTFTVSATGRLTAAANVTITPAASSITGGATLSRVNDTNVTLTLGGSPTTALLAATSLTLGWTGQLDSTKGGTGVNNAGTFTNASNTTITGGGTIALGGFTLTVPATGTATLGTGTSGQITYWSGTNTVTGSSSLLWDNTNGRVTVGGTQPTFNQSGVNVIGTNGFQVVQSSTTGSSAAFLSEDSTHYGALVRFNSAYVGNYTTGANPVPYANSFNFFTTSGNFPFVMSGNKNISVPGYTVAANIGFVNDSVGLRVDQCGSLGSTNVNPFTVVGKSFFGTNTTATALVHFGAGTATANTAPTKWTIGTPLTVAESGTIEYITSGFVLQKDSIVIGRTTTSGSATTKAIEVVAPSQGLAFIQSTVTGTTGNAEFSAYNSTNGTYVLTDVYGSASAGTKAGLNKTGMASIEMGAATGGVCLINSANAFDLVFATNNVERWRTISTGTTIYVAGSATAGTAPLRLTTGTVETVAVAGNFEYTTPTLYFTNGGAQRQELIQSQQSRVSTQFDKTNDAALANVTGLTATLVAGKIYRFEAELHLTSNITGGSQFAIAGTCTATTIIYQVILVDNGSNLNTITSRQTALAGAVGQAGTTSGYCRITGLIVVNAAGTLTVQFAQNAATVLTTSSVLVGSTFEIKQIS